MNRLAWTAALAIAPLGASLGAQIVVAPASQTIERGTALQMKPLPPAPNAPKGPRWTSSAPEIASVDSVKGIVTGRDRGKAKITATGAGGSGSADIEVIILYRSISAGDGFTCDVGSTGVAACWGHNGFQDGRLGNGALDNANMADVSAPVDVRGAVRFAQISSGSRHTCGIAADGAAFCWGSNGTAQLGNTTHRSWAHQPVAVAGGRKYTAISAGVAHTCAIAAGGAAWCWGEGGYGELGNGKTEDSAVPVAVAGGISFTSISAGSGPSACGVATDGRGYCWGNDTYGQLGDGGEITGRTTDMKLVPTPVAGGATFTSIAVGTQHACGILTSRSVMCWGNNTSGKLGAGTDAHSSTPVAVGGTFSFEQIDVGRTHSCGVTSTFQLVCWGANVSGESGSAVAVGAIAKAPALAMEGEFSKVAVSHGSAPHSCVITRDMLSVRCFGRGDMGQLGHGEKPGTNVPTPTAVLVRSQQPLP